MYENQKAADTWKLAYLTHDELELLEKIKTRQ
jgi:hypothetical protein